MSDGKGDLDDLIDDLVKQIREDTGREPDVARRIPTVAHVIARAQDPIPYGEDLAWSIVIVSSEEASLETVVVSEFLVTEHLLETLVVESTDTDIIEIETSEEDTDANPS